MVPEKLPPRKKTRDLPNLSECHNCNYRINTNNPKDKLLLLTSEWRVVLLCKLCLRGIESNQLCSYCFNNVSSLKDDDSFKCRCCSRCVHKDCITRYKNCAPWCYMNNSNNRSYKNHNNNDDDDDDDDDSDSDSDNNDDDSDNDDGSFGSCIDCWLPKEILRSSAVLREVNRKRKLSGIKGRIIIRDGSDIDGGGMKKRLVDTGKRANCEKKSMNEKKAVELGSEALNRVKKRVGNGSCNGMEKGSKIDNKAAGTVEKRGTSGDSVSKVVDDAELAFRLHRAMNSSPRISKIVNSRCLANSRSRICDNDSFYGKLYARKRQVSDKDSFYGKSYVRKKRVSDNHSFYGKSYARKKQVSCKKGVDACLVRTSDSKDDRVDVSLKEEEGSCSNNSMVMEPESLSCRKQDGSVAELQLNDSRSENEVEGHEKSDKCMLKYSRKKLSVKPFKDHTYKFLYDVCCLENQAPADGMLLNCSSESRTVSEASFQSCVVPLQATAGASGSSQCQL